ncbi:MAG TPA: hypothetical protein VFV67_13940 [Actinophytocola sp.]|uniref:hypothetical protein n=1 Tax=Actinophytocola sp. TaxID=1872138 RepID=UPI002DB567D5|nr:hypothetical protein [Actinophytocola sp.]HEU5471748.1 hypothetical protein [Actinophytocola sp.]
MDTRERARTTARLLVSLARAGDFAGVSRIVRLLTEPSVPQRDRLRQVMAELLTAAATMVVRQTGGLGPNTAIVLDLRRADGSTVDIDDLRPEVRAIVRALLAQVHEHKADVDTQIEFAMHGAADGLADGVSLVLLWTVSAMAWCEENDEPAPGWLGATAA